LRFRDSTEISLDSGDEAEFANEGMDRGGGGWAGIEAMHRFSSATGDSLEIQLLIAAEFWSPQVLILIVAAAVLHSQSSEVGGLKRRRRHRRR
jgi:hypothetical protein